MLVIALRYLEKTVFRKIIPYLVVFLAIAFLSADHFVRWTAPFMPSQKTDESVKKEPIIQLCSKLSEEKTYGDDNSFKFLVSGKNGWIFRTEMDFKQDLELSDWSVESFKRLRKAFLYNGTELSVIMIPTRGIVGSENILPPYAKQYNFPEAKKGYISILDSFKRAGIIIADTSDVDTVNGFFLKRDNHWTAKGARYSAQKMAKAIKAHEIYKSFKKVKYKTEKANLEEKQQANDRFLEFIKDACGEEPPKEYLLATYNTYPENHKDLEQALLGDKGIPDVVLLGTSNSTRLEPSYANFEGYLKEFLSIDIDNKSIPGGSFRGAIGNYILSNHYNRAKPKLIIWELSAHYGLDQKSTFREVIPALYGACKPEEAVIMTDGQSKSKKVKIFDNLGERKLFSYNYYIYMKLEDDEHRDFKIEFLHEGDEKDIFDIERSERNFDENNGNFYVELKDGLSEPLKSVTIRTKTPLGKYSARICKVPITQ